MLAFYGHGLLLDIEGTTSSVQYVYENLFPYARRELASFLTTHWDQELVAEIREQIARDAGAVNFCSFCGTGKRSVAFEKLEAEVLRLMDADSKTAGLKQLQGLIWREGYQRGELVSHLFQDVFPALREWRAAGLDLRTFSSGSVAAQKMFFAHTIAGDLLPFFSGHYDTTLGSKREASSYARIAGAMGLLSKEVLFLSDVTAELDAARIAGMHTGLVLRPGNAPVAPQHGHSEIRTFYEIIICPRAKRGATSDGANG